MDLQALDFFVLRSPLFSYNHLVDLDEQKIKAFYSNPIAQEALFLASSSLYNTTLQWLKGEANLNAKEHQKLISSLTKYLLRMSFRCTPFGLFAGISMGTTGNETKLKLEDTHQNFRKSRLDMGYLCAWGNQIAQQPEIRNQLKYFPNQTLYGIGESLRYVEYRIHQKDRSHHLVNVDDSEFIQQVLDAAKAGTTPIELANVLVDDDIVLEEALEFIHEMIDAQVLVSELEPQVTGKNYALQLADKLSQHETGQAVANQLKALIQQLEGIAELPLGEGVKPYQEIITTLKSLGVSYDSDKLFQVDMLKPAPQMQLSADVTKEVEKVVQFFARIKKLRPHPHLEDFKTAFYKKYTDQEVPLTQLLDTEVGIGYPANVQESHQVPPLLEQVLVTGEVPPTSYEWNPWQQFLFEKYSEALHHHWPEIKLTEQEIEAFHQKHPKKANKDQLPASLSSFVQLLAPSEEALAEGAFTIDYRGASGPSTANLLGRFCYMDESLTQQVNGALRKEEQTQPEAVFAEIVHLPQARLGNISLRPVLRDYEIAIMAQAMVDQEHTILLDDLMVSVVRDEIVLRSKRLNKRVIPRLSTAHNYQHNPIPAYQFLCDLQAQNKVTSFSWNWGALNNAAWLPRVTYGKSVLAKARWKISPEELGVGKRKDVDALRKKLPAICKEKNIPRYVTIAEADNVLPIDLENPLNVQVLIDTLKSGISLELTECLFTPENLVLKEGTTGAGFANELVIPLHAEPQTLTPSQTVKKEIKKPSAVSVKRDFMPGSEWLYTKVYCGYKTADKVLTELIAPFAQQLQQQGIIDQWFFIRFNDPQFHLRVRFHKAKQILPAAFYGQVMTQLQALLEPFQHSGEVDNVQIDTYKRELERYQAVNMANSEALFYCDSQTTAYILSMLDMGEAGEEFRWKLALRGVDTLLRDFGYTAASKMQLMEQMKTSFAREFHMDTKLGKKMLSQKFRNLRPQLEAILKAELPHPEDDIYPAIEAYEHRAVHWQAVIQEILKLHENGAIPSLNNLVGSYIHMFLNRFLRVRHRAQEMVLYDMLYQHYRSVVARENKQNKTKEKVG